MREQYLIFSPAFYNTDNKIINNTWIIRDSVSTIPKYHYVNTEVSKQNQYLTSSKYLMKTVRGHQKTMQSSGLMMQFFGIVCTCKYTVAYIKHTKSIMIY